MIEKKALYISFDYAHNNVTGGSSITKRNFQIISKYFNQNIFYYKIKRGKKSKIFNLFIDLINFSLGGLNNGQINEIQDLIINHNIKILVIDSTCLGKIAKSIKKFNKKIEIIIFSHNFEPKSYLDNFRLTLNFLYFFRSFACFYNELLSCRYSDYLITTTSHDLMLYKKIYYRNIKNDIVIPVSVNKTNDNNFNINKSNIKIGLFVGSWFPPNYHGIRWFILNVLPFVNMKLIIVGNGMKNILNHIPNNLKMKVEVYDFISNLNPFYNNANFVISPIFYGSGMKVKIAEALNFNKLIFCTSHSRIGYDFYSTNNKLVVCNSRNDFINKISTYNDKNYSELYSNEYIHENIEILLNDFFNKILIK